MDILPSRQISVIEPVGVAIEKTKQILFQPFDIAKWFIIGLSAWLATLGQRVGGSNFRFRKNFQSGDFRQTSEVDIQYEIQEGIQEAKQVFLENITTFIIVGMIFFTFFLAIILLISWIKSRTQFTYLDCVAKNRAEFFNPWREFAKEGNSLFLFKLSLWFISFVISSIVVVSIASLLFPIIKSDFKPAYFFNIGMIGLLVLVMIIVTILFGVIGKFTIDFVVPVMYLQRSSVLKAWNAYSKLLSNFKGMFALYVLVSIAIFFIQMTFWVSLGLLSFLGLCCCFIPCCFTIWFYLPYLGVVLTLPWYVWKRSYSALFLAQFGPQFDVFRNVPTPIVVPTASIPPEQNP